MKRLELLNLKKKTTPRIKNSINSRAWIEENALNLELQFFSKYDCIAPLRPNLGI